MKEEIIEHIKNLKEQGINVRVDENQINDLINKISDKKYKEDKEDQEDKKYAQYIYSEINNVKIISLFKDNISISYDKNKFRTKEINSLYLFN